MALGVLKKCSSGKDKMITNLMYLKTKIINQFYSWNFFDFCILSKFNMKHLFLDRIQGCFDALEKRYVRMFLSLHQY